MANVNNGVIQFTCEHCGVSLTVDDFLAGVSAPCPSCGKLTKAPEKRSKEDSPDIISKPKLRQPAARLPVGQIGEQFRNWDSGRPRKRPQRAVAETQREREEVSIVIKLLVFGVMVLGILLTAAYYVNQASNS
jgi:predicted RNA-binding Zn-ribbon protein involved in translation (DUF1610 family)